MKNSLLIIIGSIFVASCGVSERFINDDEINGSNPVRKGGEFIFNMREGDCGAKDYGDGRGESDCVNGNVQQRVWTRKDYHAPKTLEYGFDVFIDPNFTYQETLSYRPRGSIEIAEWNRKNVIKNHMYEMHLTGRGVTFEDKTCFSSSRFGEWNAVVVRAKWSNNDDGELVVRCNEKVIYSKKGPNLIPPGCGTSVKSQCKLEFIDVSKPIVFKLGPKYFGFGRDWREMGRASPFLPWPQNGINIKMRNLYEGRIRN